MKRERKALNSKWQWILNGNGRPLHNQKGFTLIEIMIVLALVAFLFSLVGVNVLKQFGKGQSKIALTQVKNFENALSTYYMELGSYPTAADGGLEALVSAPSGNERWDGPYLKEKKLPKDPWDEDYSYVSENGRGYSICSFGPDKKEGGDDDICAESN